MQAIVAFTRSLELDPNNQLNLRQRFAAYQQIGEFDDALADLAAILVLDPGNFAALNAKARIHAWRGEADLTIGAADAILAAEPSNPLLLHARATDALAERHEVVAGARQHRLHARLGVDALGELARDRQGDVLLARAGLAERLHLRARELHAVREQHVTSN